MSGKKKAPDGKICIEDLSNWAKTHGYPDSFTKTPQIIPLTVELLKLDALSEKARLEYRAVLEGINCETDNIYEGQNNDIGRELRQEDLDYKLGQIQKRTKDLFEGLKAELNNRAQEVGNKQLTREIKRAIINEKSQLLDRFDKAKASVSRSRDGSAGIGFTLSFDRFKKRPPLVLHLLKGSSAEKIGVQVNDYIKSIDGNELHDAPSFQTMLPGTGLCNSSTQIAFQRGTDIYIEQIARDIERLPLLNYDYLTKSIPNVYIGKKQLEVLDIK